MLTDDPQLLAPSFVEDKVPTVAPALDPETYDCERAERYARREGLY